MLGLNENFKKIFKTKDKADSSPSPIDFVTFNSFLRQQALWIKEHMEYERDMEHNLSKTNNVLVRFDINQYVTNFDNYFSEQGLYKHKAEDLFILLLTILAPTEEISSLLSKENRKRLFVGVLINLSLNTDVKLADLIKSYYGKINSIKDTLLNTSRENLLELFKEAIELVDKEYEKQTEIEKPKQPEDMVDVPELLTELLKSFSIHSRTDLVGVFTKANLLSFCLSIVFYLLVIIMLFIISPGINQVFNNIFQGQVSPILAQLCIAVFIILGIMNTLVFMRNRIKKKFLLRSLRMMIKYFNIPHNVLDTFFQSKYQFDIRKLK